MSKVKGLGVHFIAPGGRCLFTCLPVKLDIPKTKTWFGGRSLGTKRSIPQAYPQKSILQVNWHDWILGKSPGKTQLRSESHCQSHASEKKTTVEKSVSKKVFCSL